MQYQFSERSFARDLFVAAKEKLGLQAPAASAMPSQWMGMTDYGTSFIFPSHVMTFRTVRGGSVRTASTPLCFRDPVSIIRMSQAAWHHARCEKRDGMQPQSQSPHQSTPGPGSETASISGNGAAAQGPPFGGEAQQSSGIRQAQALSHSSSGLSTAVLSTLLAIAAAITAGLIVGNNSASRFGFGSDERQGESISSTGAAAAIGNAGLSQSLALAPAFHDGQIPAVTDSRAETAPQGRKPQGHKLHRKDAPPRKIKGRGADKENPHVPDRQARQAAAGKGKTAGMAASRRGTSRQRVASGANPNVSLHARQAAASPGTQYARCERVKGLLRRERCRWDACGDKWGKQGCPAYKHHGMPEYGVGQIGQPGRAPT